MLVDSHAHVDMSRFNSDRTDVIKRAIQGGVTRIVDPGCDLPSSLDAVRLAQRWPGVVYAGIGVHPHYATSYTPDVRKRFATLVREPGVVAIGEFGLDYYRNLSPKEKQREVFLAHLEMAREYDLPCIIHVRESHDDVMELLRSHGSDLRGVIHCFSGTIAQAREVLAFPGFLFGIGGPLTKQGNELPEVVRMLPLDRIMVETDSPYLVPKPRKDRRNEPLFVTDVAQKLADILGLPLATVAARTTANAIRLFGLGEEANHETL